MEWGNQMLRAVHEKKKAAQRRLRFARVLSRGQEARLQQGTSLRTRRVVSGYLPSAKRRTESGILQPVLRRTKNKGRSKAAFAPNR